MNNYDNDSHPYDNLNCVSEKKSDDASAFVLTIGILSLITMINWFSGFIGLILAIIGVVKGTSIRHKSSAAMAGWILSIISLCLFGIGVILVIGFMIPPLWIFM